MAGNPVSYQAGHQCRDRRTWAKIWVKLSPLLCGEMWQGAAHRVQETVKSTRPAYSIASCAGETL